MAANLDLQIQRRVHFYRLDAGVVNGHPVPIDVDAVLAKVQAIPLGSPGRYVDSGDDRLLVLVDRAHAHHRIRLVRIRSRDIPQKELAGVLEALPLAEGEGIADVVHAVFFPHGNIGFEFNFYGARASSLAYYLGEVVDACPAIRTRPLAQHDFMSALDRAGAIKLLDIRVHRSYIDRLAQVDQNLFTALSAASNLGEPDEFELILRPKLHSRGGSLGNALVRMLQTLLGRDDVIDGVDRLRVETVATSNRPSEAIDLLQERMIYTETMLRLNATTRAIASDSAYVAIHNAWEANRDLIESAAIM